MKLVLRIADTALNKIKSYIGRERFRDTFETDIAIVGSGTEAMP